MSEWNRPNTVLAAVTPGLESVAALKALAVPTGVEVYHTLGYGTAGDGGHGKYWWNSADTRSDNGGTILQPDTLPATGRWNLMYDESVNNKQFGSKGDNVQDDITFLQAWVDWLIATNVKGVWLPGEYKITSPLLLMKRSGSTYSTFSLTIEGTKYTYRDPSWQVRLLPTFTDTFAIGIQRARAISLQNIMIQGQNAIAAILGDINDNTDYENFGVNSNYVTGGCRDSQYSPYAAIVIDPFGTSVPADGGYPGLNSYYTSTAGSSGNCVFKGLFIREFVVGVMITPNGITLNAEQIWFDNCRIEQCKSGFAIGQSQSRTVSYTNGRSSQCLYCFDGANYGSQTGYAPRIDTVSCSGKYLFNVKSQFNQPSVIADALYCESAYSIGFLGISGAGGLMPSVLRGCSFRLRSVETYPDFHLMAWGPVNFQSCYFDRESPGEGGRLSPFRIFHYGAGGAALMKFDACVFHMDVNYDLELYLAFTTGGAGSAQHLRDITFDNCWVNRDNTRGLTQTALSQQIQAHRDNTINGGLVAPGGQYSFAHSSQKGKFYVARAEEATITLGSLTVTDGNDGTATFTAADGSLINTGDLIFSNTTKNYEAPDGDVDLAVTWNCLGQVTNVAGNDVTIAGFPQNLGSGTYELYMFWWPRFHQGSTGDTNSSTSLTNVSPASAWKIGQKIRGSGIVDGTHITNIVGSTFTLSKAATATATGVRLYDADIYEFAGAAV